MNKKIIFAIIIIILFFIVTIPANIESESQIKQGILTNVEMGSANTFLLWGSTESAIILSFSDGFQVTCVEDDAEDAQEMFDYMSIWIGQEIIVEYSYDYYRMANEIDSVSSAN